MKIKISIQLSKMHRTARVKMKRETFKQKTWSKWVTYQDDISVYHKSLSVDCIAFCVVTFSANEKDYIGYEISNCRIGQEYKICVQSFHEPEPFESDDRRVTCGCSTDYSPVVKCAPVSPPKSPKLYIKSISSQGIEIAWDRAKEFGSASLSVCCREFMDLFRHLKYFSFWNRVPFW